MAQVQKQQTDGKDKEKLPNPPVEGEAKKGWVAKRIDNVQRALKAARTLVERLSPVARLKIANKVHADHVSALVDAADEAVKNLDEALDYLVKLGDGNFIPALGPAQIAVGQEVWLSQSLWRQKYAGLFQPEELAGLKVEVIAGGRVRAVSKKGKVIVEKAGQLKTTAVDYTAAGTGGEGGAG